MRPFKVTGWGQNLYTDSIRKKEIVGTFRQTQDNRGYRYILAGAANLAQGKLTSSIAESPANLVDENVVKAAAIGDYVIEFTPGGAVTLTLDELEGGFYWVNDATGEGQMYRIAGNMSRSTTDFVITLDEPMRVATVVTTTQHSLMLNPYSKIVICTTVDFFLTGTPQYPIATTRYGWSQTQGWGVTWITDNTAIAGAAIMPHTTNGESILNDDFTEQNVGWVGPSIGVSSNEYKAVFFTMEGCY